MPVNPYFEKFKVRAAEIGPGGDVKPSAVINYFQEAAWQHADLLGVSVPALMERGHTWVMHRLHLQLLESIEKDSVLEIETWPSDIEKFFTFRDFRFRDEHGRLVAQGTTAWVVIDLGRRRLIPIPDYIASGDFAIDNNPMPHPVGKLPEPGEPQVEPDGLLIGKPWFKVHYQHLDQNNHVNNVNYFEWMLASIPQDYLLSMRLREVDIQFKSECMLGDVIEGEFEQLSETEVLHRLTEKHSQREVARAVTVWADK